MTLEHRIRALLSDKQPWSAAEVAIELNTTDDIARVTMRRMELSGGLTSGRSEGRVVWSLA